MLCRKKIALSGVLLGKNYLNAWATTVLSMLAAAQILWSGKHGQAFSSCLCKAALPPRVSLLQKHNSSVTHSFPKVMPFSNTAFKCS